MAEGGVDAKADAKLIVTILKKGVASRVVAATKKAGASGGTIVLARGTANKDIYLKFLGMEYEPEKEIVLTVADRNMVDTMLQTIVQEAQLDKPGNGIAMVLDLKRLIGVVHLMANFPVSQSQSPGGER
ncbi:nitrogen regulatory protein P-II family [Hydrogenispora ethanolica]|uniref:Nitrogen regulatory protein P-II family n=1 Tax=Hydrogenispora ethanolica TaxID=1082276 RepID=A0A4R1R8A2_HYDET|nr:P-II family nitrogen regulator [Hydrogenispora ethanolica]TCL61866.1 nitrogen regulatory protein P-II family [Hydrogenispora ethanolica]